MARIKSIVTALSMVLIAAAGASAQTYRQRISPTNTAAGAQRQCLLTGAYRIDAVESDQLYSVVKDATSSVPFSQQQRFFIDLSTRLTPPDMLAIECHGSRVSVASSRAARVTYLADGRSRRERTPAGNFVNSRVELQRDSLSFVSTGKAEDSVNVGFRVLEGGRRLLVTRRIYAEQLAEPILIRTFYDKISDSVNWETYDGGYVAKQIPAEDQRPLRRPAVSRAPAVSRSSDAALLRDALDDWLEATNRRDINGQMHFYMPRLKAYYLARDTPASAVRSEKNRVFAGVRSVDIRAREPEIVFQEAGRTAIMRFIKDYRVLEGNRTRSGAVVQELRWQRTNDGWRIFSERDVRVIR